MKRRIIVLLVILMTALLLSSCDELKDFFSDETGSEEYIDYGGNGKSCTVKWAGVRVSSYGMVRREGKYGVKNPYAFDEFPSVSEMSTFGSKMASCYEGSTGAYILIVGTMSGEDSCSLAFPIDGEYNYIWGSKYDAYEDYLDEFDKLGYSVWLQVEPGYADLVTLAKLVLDRYGHHSCVKGFGIDVEWHKPIEDSDEGTKLSDTDVKKVLAKVRSYNSSYTVFVKHWMTEQLPSRMEGLIYVNDSQQFKTMEEVIEDFSQWAAYYAPQPVMFQIGYEADRGIWNGTSYKNNPAKLFGQAIVDKCKSGNEVGIIWVDFTLANVINKTSN